MHRRIFEDIIDTVEKTDDEKTTSASVSNEDELKFTFDTDVQFDETADYDLGVTLYICKETTKEVEKLAELLYEILDNSRFISDNSFVSIASLGEHVGGKLKDYSLIIRGRINKSSISPKRMLQFVIRLNNAFFDRNAKETESLRVFRTTEPFEDYVTVQYNITNSELNVFSNDGYLHDVLNNPVVYKKNYTRQLCELCYGKRRVSDKKIFDFIQITKQIDILKVIC